MQRSSWSRWIGGRSGWVAALAIGAVQLSLATWSFVGQGKDIKEMPMPIHDPAMVWTGKQFVLFNTNNRLKPLYSKDLDHWETGAPVYGDAMPSWAQSVAPGAHDMWAPDLANFGGRWWLYFCVSRFGSRVSGIGVASNLTLDPQDPRYQWKDHGVVIASTNASPYNAIDPGILVEGNRVRMVFGSWSRGIYEVEIDRHTGLLKPGDVPTQIANRGHDGVEGPALFKRGRYYYLLTSWDLCCQGLKSTYNTRVGRSTSPEGPFVDRDGVSLDQGGGTLLASNLGRYHGRGGGSMMKIGTNWYYVHHYYDGQRNGFPALAISHLKWTEDGWPELETPSKPTIPDR